MSDVSPLTKEQEEIRLQGLRILARMIARARLDASRRANGPVAGCAKLSGGTTRTEEEFHGG